MPVRRCLHMKKSFKDVRPGEIIYDDRIQEAHMSPEQYLNQHNKVYGYNKNPQENLTRGYTNQ